MYLQYPFNDNETFLIATAGTLCNMRLGVQDTAGVGKGFQKREKPRSVLRTVRPFTIDSKMHHAQLFEQALPAFPNFEQNSRYD